MRCLHPQANARWARKRDAETQLASNAHHAERVAPPLCNSTDWSECVVFLMKSPFDLRRPRSVPIELLLVLPKAMVNAG